MNLQTMFNRVVKHAMQMEKPCITVHGTCLYREGKEANSKSRCFIGALIRDEDYDYHAMEGRSVRDEKGKAVREAAGISGNLIEPAYRLQCIHDERPMSDWPYLLDRFAIDYDLKVPAVLAARLDA